VCHRFRTRVRNPLIWTRKPSLHLTQLFHHLIVGLPNGSDATIEIPLLFVQGIYHRIWSENSIEAVQPLKHQIKLDLQNVGEGSLLGKLSGSRCGAVRSTSTYEK
jgi:hypothetical protein